ncbi:MAG TPA: hypothetical protein VKR52_13310 [Terracidiphilus sp.]|nr:hypothetical protein [Terracidiphilus sp.]
MFRSSSHSFRPASNLLSIALGMSLAVATLSPAAHAQAGRFNIQQVGDALTSYGKNTVNNNGQTYYSVVCGHDSWKSSVIVSLSPNANVIWLQLDLVQMPSNLSPAAMANLLKKNTELGPVFFSISDNWLRISSPLPNNDMSEAKIKGYLERLVNLAVDNHDLWDSKILAMAPAPASRPGSATHASYMRRSVDEFDASFRPVQR